MPTRIFRIILLVPMIVIMVTIIVINARLYHRPSKPEIVKELHGIRNAIAGHADENMQEIFPEGFVFLDATYALAWSSFVTQNKEYFEEGHSEMQWICDKLSVTAPRGSFYLGWNSYVLGSKLSIEDPGTRRSDEVRYFKQLCDTISVHLGRRTYPETYIGSAWPADVVMCAASLSLHDRLFEAKYKEVIDKWLSEVKTKLDARGMIPHSVYTDSGKPEESARGSSMALMLIFLPSIDKSFADDQFLLFKENFIESKFGLTGIREYPKGESGDGDIDSGPVIMSIGGAATIVGMHTVSIYGEAETALRIQSGVEVLAFPFEGKDEKTYVFGLLPMADSFIAWSHTGVMELPQKNPWFIEFHLYSILLFMLFAIAFWYLMPRARASSR